MEEAHHGSEGNVAAPEEVVTRRLREAELLCLIGFFPPGVPDDFYAHLARAAREAGVRVLVDAKATPLRATLEQRLFLVKPNLEETVDTLDLASNGQGEHEAREAVFALTGAGVEWALVSIGETGSLLGNDSGDLWHVEPRG